MLSTRLWEPVTGALAEHWCAMHICASWACRRQDERQSFKKDRQGSLGHASWRNRSQPKTMLQNC